MAKKNSTNTRICKHKFNTVMHQQEVFWSPSYLPFSNVQKFHSLVFLFCVIIMYCHLPASENSLSWTFKLKLRNLVQPSYVECMYKKPVNSNMSRSYFLSTVSENFAFLAGQWEIFDSVWHTLATGLASKHSKNSIFFWRGLCIWWKVRQKCC